MMDGGNNEPNSGKNTTSENQLMNSKDNSGQTADAKKKKRVSFFVNEEMSIGNTDDSQDDTVQNETITNSSKNKDESPIQEPAENKMITSTKKNDNRSMPKPDLSETEQDDDPGIEDNP